MMWNGELMGRGKRWFKIEDEDDDEDEND